MNSCMFLLLNIDISLYLDYLNIINRIVIFLYSKYDQKNFIIKPINKI